MLILIVVLVMCAIVFFRGRQVRGLDRRIRAHIVDTLLIGVLMAVAIASIGVMKSERELFAEARRDFTDAATWIHDARELAAFKRSLADLAADVDLWCEEHPHSKVCPRTRQTRKQAKQLLNDFP